MGPGQVFDADFIRFLTQLGAGGSIAGLIFWFYRKDVKSYTELWQAQAERNDKQTMAMMSLIERTTVTIATNTEVVKSLHRRMDRLDILRLFPDDQPRADDKG